MSSVLHILNGDCTAEVFQQMKLLEGDYIVWRELLSEGPVMTEVNSKQFWETRAAYIGKAYRATLADYQRKVLFEVALLQTLHCYDELVLWFDHDLVCQINLLAVCKLLNDLAIPATSISLMANEPSTTTPQFRAFTRDNALTLFEKRKALNKKDIETAARLWDAYALELPQNLGQ